MKRGLDPEIKELHSTGRSAQQLDTEAKVSGWGSCGGEGQEAGQKEVSADLTVLWGALELCGPKECSTLGEGGVASFWVAQSLVVTAPEE